MLSTVPEQEYKFGKAKLFLRPGVIALLEKMRCGCCSIS